MKLLKTFHIRFTYYVIVALLFCGIFQNCFAFNLVGTWKLISIEKKLPNNTWVPDCFSPTGLITYTPQGYMAVGLNCMEKDKIKKPNFTPNDMAFYTGKYIFETDKVTHIVRNASDPVYYGKRLERAVKIIDDNAIVLVAREPDGRIVRLRWDRVIDGV